MNDVIDTEVSLLPGVNVLLMGPAGTGKTYCIGSLADSGVETFYLPLETGMSALLRYFDDAKKPVPANLHWHEPIGIGRDISDLAAMAEDIGKLPQESLYKMVDMTRAVNNQFAKVHRVIEDFTDQNGKSWGKVTKWGPDRALVLDGLTGFGRFALHMAAGKKPVLSQPDWGIAQKQVENFLQLMCDSRCHFILIGHIEREVDQLTGGVKVMVRSLGRALPPIIPPMFNDVVLTVRDGRKWTWDTAASNVDLKTVHLPVEAGQPPTFATIIDKWRALGGRFTPTIKTGRPT
jgi:hypothetical protein